MVPAPCLAPPYIKWICVVGIYICRSGWSWQYKCVTFSVWLASFPCFSWMQICVHRESLISLLTWAWHIKMVLTMEVCNLPPVVSFSSVSSLICSVDLHLQVWLWETGSCGRPKGVCPLLYTHSTLATVEPLLKSTSEIRTPCLTRHLTESQFCMNAHYFEIRTPH